MPLIILFSATFFKSLRKSRHGILALYIFFVFFSSFCFSYIFWIMPSLPPVSGNSEYTLIWQRTLIIKDLRWGHCAGLSGWAPCNRKARYRRGGGGFSGREEQCKEVSRGWRHAALNRGYQWCLETGGGKGQILSWSPQKKPGLPAHILIFGLPLLW